MKTARVFSLLICLLLFSSYLFAEENPFQVTLDTKFIPSSDVEHQSGDIEIVESHIRIKGKFNIFDNIPLEASIGEIIM